MIIPHNYVVVNSLKIDRAGHIDPLDCASRLTGTSETSSTSQLFSRHVEKMVQEKLGSGAWK